MVNMEETKARTRAGKKAKIRQKVWDEYIGGVLPDTEAEIERKNEERRVMREVCE